MMKPAPRMRKSQIATQDARRREREKREREQKIKDSERTCLLYTREKRTVNAIAIELHREKRFVTRALKENNIPLRRQRSAGNTAGKHWELAAERYYAEKHLNSVAQWYHKLSELKSQG